MTKQQTNKREKRKKKEEEKIRNFKKDIISVDIDINYISSWNSI